MTDEKPIIRLFFARIKDEFHDLSDEEKMAFMQRDRKNMDELGVKIRMMIDCRWSNEEWDWVGVEEWPSLEALVKRGEFERETLRSSRYVESMTFMGIGEALGDYGKE